MALMMICSKKALTDTPLYLPALLYFYQANCPSAYLSLNYLFSLPIQLIGRTSALRKKIEICMV